MEGDECMQAYEKNRVNVVIDGREYTILGTESEEYITRIAQKVDAVITACGASSVSFAMKLVLASLNLADEAEKKNGKIAELEKLLEMAEEKNDILQRNLNSLRSEARGNIVKIRTDLEDCDE